MPQIVLKYINNIIVVSSNEFGGKITSSIHLLKWFTITKIGILESIWNNKMMMKNYIKMSEYVVEACTWLGHYFVAISLYILPQSFWRCWWRIVVYSHPLVLPLTSCIIIFSSCGHYTTYLFVDFVFFLTKFVDFILFLIKFIFFLMNSWLLPLMFSLLLQIVWVLVTLHVVFDCCCPLL